jgi:hypothetical protein
MNDQQIDDLWLHRPSIHNGELMPQLRDFARAVSAEKDEQIRKLREALEVLYAAYCYQMHSEYDFPGSPWTPDRDKDTAAASARAALKEES